MPPPRPGPPLERVRLAWRDPGVRPDLHARAQGQVRRVMPILARELDSLVKAQQLQGSTYGQQIRQLQSVLPKHEVAAELRALHYERPLTPFDTTRAPGGPPICNECRTTFPCTTIKILDKGAS